MEPQTNEAPVAASAPSNTTPTDDAAAKMEALTRRLERAEAELDRRDLKQTVSDARDAFVKSLPQGVPSAYSDILFEYAKATSALSISKTGWHWKGARDPVQGASEFWKTIPTVEPVAPQTQTASVGIPIPQAPKTTLSQLFGGF